MQARGTRHGHQCAVTAPVARLGLDSVARGDTLGSRRRRAVALVLLSGRRRRLPTIIARVSCQGSRRITDYSWRAAQAALSSLRAAARSHRRPRSLAPSTNEDMRGAGGHAPAGRAKRSRQRGTTGPRGGHGHTRAAYPHGDATQCLQP